MDGASDTEPARGPANIMAPLDQWLEGLKNTPYSADTACWNRIFNAAGEIRAAIGAVDRAASGGQ